jgi:NTP pyrophosphatase (non-canonical NTP hydrolase)
MTTFKEIADKVREKRGDQAALWQAITLAEENGEALQEFRRWQGQARTLGTKEKFSEELADVIITAYVFAELTGVDLDNEVSDKLQAIEKRGGL